jgi:polyphosphate kinase 2 (PPK2 family)
MLDQVDLSSSVSKEDHAKLAPPLYERLRLAQYALKDARIPTVIVFEGWDAAGKGLAISRLLKRIDPRGFQVYPARPPTEDEQLRPFLYRFWIRLPARGEMALFDRSWYGRVLIERVAKMIPKQQWMSAFDEIAQFERQIADDGTAIAKFYLHISKAEQKRRLKRLDRDKFESWRVTKWDWKHHHDYDKYVVAIEEAFERTHAPYAPWTVVPATDWRHAELTIFRTLVDAMESRLAAAAPTKARAKGARHA